MFVFKGFSHPKDPQSGTTEDAWRADNLQNVVVVSDGASSTLFSGLWANLLCDGVINNCPDPMDHFNFPQWLETLRAKWTSNIDYNSLSWYQKPKIATGACATLAWASIEPSAEIPDNLDDDTPLDTPFFRVSGYTIGDACVMHFHAGKLFASVPLARSIDFNTMPPLLSSVNTGVDVSSAFVPFDFLVPEGDWLILATDAMSQWILQLCESGDVPDWQTLWSATPEQFSEFVEFQREQHNIHIDDTTIVICCLGTAAYLSREFNLDVSEQITPQEIPSKSIVNEEQSIEKNPPAVENSLLQPTPVPVVETSLPKSLPETEQSQSGFSSYLTYNPGTNHGAAVQKTVSMSSVFLDFSSTDGPVPDKDQKQILPIMPKSENRISHSPVPPPIPDSVSVTSTNSEAQTPLPPPVVQHRAVSEMNASSRSVSNQNPKPVQRPAHLPKQPSATQRSSTRTEKNTHLTEGRQVPPIPSGQSEKQEKHKNTSAKIVNGSTALSPVQRGEKTKQVNSHVEQKNNEQEDNFAFQFKKGMSEGIQDMKDGIQELISGQVGEQAKEAFKKGKDKVTKMFSGLFKKKE